MQQEKEKHEKNMNRSQRCGQCRGCTAKPCGVCVYCQDSPQFGGPGVKKQSCLERRCYRVLENRLQRDGPSFKAKIGCSNCEECMVPDCQTCLVCLDRKFFENRFLPGALCAKKRCNQARNLEHSPFPSVPAAASINGNSQQINTADFVMQSPSPGANNLMFSPFHASNPPNAQRSSTTPNGKRHSPSSKSDEKPARPRKKKSKESSAANAKAPPGSQPQPAPVSQPSASFQPQQPLAAVAITHHPIVQIQNPGYDHIVTNGASAAPAQQGQPANGVVFSAQLTASAQPAPGTTVLPQNGTPTTYADIYSIQQRNNGDISQASTQFDNRLLGQVAGQNPLQHFQSFNGLGIIHKSCD